MARSGNIGNNGAYLKTPIMRKIDQELSLRLLHFLSAEMNIPLSLPPNMPGGNEEEGENEEEAFF